MSSEISKPHFKILDSIGNNYLTWYIDIKIELRSEGLEKIFLKTDDDDEKS